MYISAQCIFSYIFLIHIFKFSRADLNSCEKIRVSLFLHALKNADFYNRLCFLPIKCSLILVLICITFIVSLSASSCLKVLYFLICDHGHVFCQLFSKAVGHFFCWFQELSIHTHANRFCMLFLLDFCLNFNFTYHA